MTNGSKLEKKRSKRSACQVSGVKGNCDVTLCTCGNANTGTRDGERSQKSRGHTWVPGQCFRLLRGQADSTYRHHTRTYDSGFDSLILFLKMYLRKTHFQNVSSKDTVQRMKRQAQTRRKSSQSIDPIKNSQNSTMKKETPP